MGLWVYGFIGLWVYGSGFREPGTPKGGRGVNLEEVFGGSCSLGDKQLSMTWLHTGV